MSETTIANTLNTPAAQGGAPQVERPSWLPDQFQSGEEMAKRYAELEDRQGQRREPEHGSPAEGVPSTHQDAKALVASAGLNFDALQDEYFSSGQLSSETYAHLERAGISHVVADQYIAGQRALAEGIRSDVFSVAGGSEQYADMVGWASTAFSDDEIAGFNATMNSGDRYMMKLAVDGLKARYIDEHGSPPSLLGGSSGLVSGSAGGAYGSTRELTAAMSDPRYATDAAYRSDVIARLGRSNIL